MKILKADVVAAQSWALPDGSHLGADVFDRLSIQSGQPLFLADDFRPVPALTRYLLDRSVDLKSETAFQYAYELRKLADFLCDRGEDVRTASNQDLRKYRAARLDGKEKPIGASAWNRNAAAIRGLFEWMVENKLRPDTPYASGRGRSALWGPAAPDEKIRALSLAEWTNFRDVGIRGYAIDGGASGRRLLSNTGRMHLGAELALTTGMRLQEFSSLLLPEISYSGEPRMQNLELQAVAKFGNYRVVYLIPRLLRQADLYVRTERPFYAQRRVKHYEKHHREYFKVESVDPAANRVVGIHDGVRRRLDLATADRSLRAIMIHEGTFGLESICLFLSRTGAPLGRHSWFQDFNDASTRTFSARSGGKPDSSPRQVRPHDLRHTFAVRILQHYMVRAKDDARIHTVDLHEHLIWNPVLTVQRLLGHRQPSTTLKYLRHVQDMSETMTDAWGGWEDPELSFADYAEFLLESASL